MNRSQRRDFIKKLKKKGYSDEEIRKYLLLLEAKARVSNDIVDGSKVTIDIDFVKSRKDYGRLVPEYRRFIESSKDKVFTAHHESGDLFSLDENNNKWVFWSGELRNVKVEE